MFEVVEVLSLRELHLRVTSLRQGLWFFLMAKIQLTSVLWVRKKLRILCGAKRVLEL